MARISTMDLESASLTDINTELDILFRGLNWQARLFTDLSIYRARRVETRPLSVGEITYPPVALCQRYQRANAPNESCFYASAGENGVFFELNAKPGDYLCISRWETTERLSLVPVGYSRSVLSRLKSNRTDQATFFPVPDSGVPTKEAEVGDFLNEVFTQIIPAEKDHFYKISVSIARRFMRGKELDGILYPAIAMSGNTDNLALKPSTVDRRLVLREVQYVRVDARDGMNFQITRVDFATSFPGGSISWMGRWKHWQLTKQGEMLHFEVKGGKLTARDESGRAVEPH